MNKEFSDIIRIVGYIFLIILLVVIIYQVIRAIFGGTWQTENIIIGALGVILSALFVIVGFLVYQSNTIGKIEERTKTIGESLPNLGRDFKEHVKDK
ncbi:MAG: hypothetical protein WC781_02955 [Candidatus Pacearchaeota archaeon]|jgi:NADH:ubiquinone oxidoreductase subunit 6 (subunit J)